jgi:protein-tyrosine phosphatase
MKILVVCLGNICRSPIAEGILQHIAAEEDLPWSIDSAGTSGWHNGEQPDRRAIRTCKQRGIDISGQRSRLFTRQDFHVYDHIITMDDSNYHKVLSMATNGAEQQKVKKMMAFAPEYGDEVPDPYYDGRFDEVFELLEGVCREVVKSLSGER